MYWKTSAVLFGIGANAKEIGCMTRNDFKLREERKKETRKGILLGIAEGLRGFSEGYSQGSNQGYYAPNAGQIRLRNQIQANKYQQDLRNLQQSHENHRQRMQQFNNQQTQMYKNFHQSTPYKPYGGYSSPYGGYSSPYSY